MEDKPLNIFQRCIRIWEEAHPYNAAQILEIGGTADVVRLSAAWNAALAACGLGAVHVNATHFRYEKAAEQRVEVVPAEVGLDGFITRELNRPFDVTKRGGSAVVVPFRPFVFFGGGAAGGSHHLGVIYQHWVADSNSMRMLLREWFRRLHDPARASDVPLHVPAGGFWRYFGPGAGKWHLEEGLVSVVESMASFGRARRIDEAAGSQRVECSVHRLPDGVIEAVRAAARGRRARGMPGATVNDVLLAALGRACDAHGAAPRRSERDLALGTIADLRAQSQEDLGNTFGLFLGFTSLVVTAEHLRDREKLLSSIAVQNVRQKESKAAQVSLLRMAAGYAQGRFLSQEGLAAFYREYMPLAGGVSNVNMNRSWPAEYHPGVLRDYIRVAPTGPMVPVVVAVTTLGNRFTFTLTRRASLVDEAGGRALAQAFIDELTAYAKTG